MNHALETAKEILNNEPYTHSDAHRELANSFLALYLAVNYMMAELGAEGGIGTNDPAVITVMDYLYVLDNGVFKEDLAIRKEHE